VETDISGQDLVVITIKGAVLEASAAKIKVEPKKIRIGTIIKGSITNIDLKIINEGRQPLVISRIQNVEATDRYFDADKQGPLVIGPNASTVFSLPFFRDAPGPFVQVIFIESNARNAAHGRHAIMVIGELKAN